MSENSLEQRLTAPKQLAVRGGIMAKRQWMPHGKRVFQTFRSGRRVITLGSAKRAISILPVAGCDVRIVIKKCCRWSKWWRQCRRTGLRQRSCSPQRMSHWLPAAQHVSQTPTPKHPAVAPLILHPLSLTTDAVLFWGLFAFISKSALWRKRVIYTIVRQCGNYFAEAQNVFSPFLSWGNKATGEF